ncbi:iron complex transport system permease protein [Paenibacillus sp. 1_12]|uniref:FecCD family ABC transporter permease n=1 Tax=Paenibacillus sp. 1_12 TaxID=1566278 RepID=UPI0008E8F6DB|nr:iron ABC transporter permease [Paenibacillus sp. 1_12]SFL36138.1 iron complex transport system permease protein [Paenibacillus sp. 1_12]
MSRDTRIHASRTYSDPSASQNQAKKRRLSPSFLILLLSVGMIIGVLLFITTGAANIQLSTVWEAILHYDENQVQHYTVLSVRLPRAVTAIIVGGCFAVSGAIMQGMTRNPLASPSLLGVSAGARFGLVLGFAFLPHLSYQLMIVISMLGAAFGAMTVYGVGMLAAFKGSEHVSHVKLALAGAAVSALLAALSEGIQIYFGIAQEVMYWYAAGIAGVKWMHVWTIIPWAVVGLVLSLMISRNITMLSLGEEVATGLGQRVKWVKFLGALTVFALTGAAVAVAGPIGFIGLIIPHVTRFLIGVDYRWVIPCSGMFGGWFLLMADTVSRWVNPPLETPVGILTALLGVPFFLYLARRGGRGSL